MQYSCNCKVAGKISQGAAINRERTTYWLTKEAAVCTAVYMCVCAYLWVSVNQPSSKHHLLVRVEMCVGEGVESRIRRSGGEGKKERKRERERVNVIVQRQVFYQSMAFS